MPAQNMAGPVSVPSNPSGGKFVAMSPFSGPTDSPLDNDQDGNNSTGALSTGIGIGANHVISAPADPNIKDSGFTDNAAPGVTLPSGSASTTAILTAIGGGRSAAATNGEAVTDPLNAQPILGFGGGVQRDAGAGPIFTGHGMKIVTAAGTVADAAVIETGFTNRSGVTMTIGQSALGSETAASPVVDFEVFVEGIALEPESDTITDEETLQLTWEFSPPNATDQGVTFESSNDSFATVDTDGLVTGVAAGSVTITVTTDDGGHTDTSIITVTAA